MANPLALDLASRLRDYAEDRMVLGNVSAWLCKHTRLHGHPFTFKGHEFQEEIVNSDHFDTDVIKPSQVGLSECSARVLLAFLASNQGVTAIYTMPTVQEAQRFSKARIDPVIEGSSTLRSLVKSAADSSSFKQLGQSQVFMAGTFGKALISIPTDLLVVDERDFSNPETLRTAESRLTHSRFAFDPETGLPLKDTDADDVSAVRGIKKSFSTPTLPDVGVSASYALSDMRKRLVRCKSCGEWFWPSFLDHCVVDGIDKKMDEITYFDVHRLEARGLVNTCRMLCPSCHNPVTKANLMPEYREWVAERPHVKSKRGFHVSPFDLPTYHTPVSLFLKLKDYGPETGHFRNFALGLPYADSTNSVVDSVVESCMVLTPVPPDQALATGVTGCVAGLDIGKVSWFIVGKIVGDRVHILWLEPIPLSEPGMNEGGNLLKRVLELLRAYRVISMVCDGYPYTDVILAIKQAWPMTHPADYALRDAALPMYVPREADGSVSCNRTKCLDYVVKRVNSGYFLFPKMEEMAVARQHLQGMKRVERKDDEGKTSADWVKCKDDHYFHALNYLNVAADGLERSFISEWLPVPSFTQAKVGVNAIEDK